MMVLTDVFSAHPSQIEKSELVENDTIEEIDLGRLL